MSSLTKRRVSFFSEEKKKKTTQNRAHFFKYSLLATNPFVLHTQSLREVQPPPFQLKTPEWFATKGAHSLGAALGTHPASAARSLHPHPKDLPTPCDLLPSALSSSCQNHVQQHSQALLMVLQDHPAALPQRQGNTDPSGSHRLTLLQFFTVTEQKLA